MQKAEKTIRCIIASYSQSSSFVFIIQEVKSMIKIKKKINAQTEESNITMKAKTLLSNSK